MTKKASGQQSSRPKKDLLDEFRQRLPQRDPSSPNDQDNQRAHIEAIKARMAAAKSDLNMAVETRLDRAISTPVSASVPAPDLKPDLTSETTEPPMLSDENIQPDVAPKPAAKTTKDKPSGDAEEFETNDGFQIFKSRAVPQKPALTDAPEHVESDKSAVEPVPMAPDAIEDALKLIEEEDQSNLASSAKTAVGFTPSNLMTDDADTNDLPIGDFGASEASNQNQITHDDADSKHHGTDDFNTSRDEMDLAAALSAELSQSTPDHDMATIDEASCDEIGAKVSVLDHDHRRNIDIGRNVASSIKSIIRDEVDETLDRIARQAVRDALKAHRAI